MTGLNASCKIKIRLATYQLFIIQCEGKQKFREIWRSSRIPPRTKKFGLYSLLLKASKNADWVLMLTFSFFPTSTATKHTVLN